MTDASVPGGHLPDDRPTGEQPPTDRLVGGRYRLLRRLGRGGMAVVWQARDEVLHRDVAVKEVLPPRDLAPGQRDEIRQRAMREARAAARLTHPSVVTVYDVVEDGGRPWIVMELLPPRTLADVLAASGPLPPAATARLGAELLDALRTAHAAGVLHRDVKPSNVMIADDGHAVLTDFGIATVEEDPSITATGMLVGSPGYMAPERARGERPTPASDLWSLGATLFAAAEGDAPFRREGQLATLHAVISQDPPPAVHAGALQPLIARLLARDPAQRPGVDEAYHELHRIANGLPGAGAAGPDGGGRPYQAPTEVIAAPGPTATRPLPFDTPPAPQPPYSGPPASHPSRAPYQGYGDGYGAPPAGPRTSPVRPAGAPGPRRNSGLGAFVALATIVVVAAAAIAYVLAQQDDGGAPTTPVTRTTATTPATTTSEPPVTSAPPVTTTASPSTTTSPPTSSTTTTSPEPTTTTSPPTTTTTDPEPSGTTSPPTGDESPPAGEA